MEGHNNTCECEDGWVGDKCDTWEAVCAHACGSCPRGAFPEQCDVCSDNAYFNEFGICTCHHDWTGDYCESYIGECDMRCNGCHGPGASNCKECLKHSHLHHGECVCDQDWTGSDCSLYSAGCDLKCEGCYGYGSGDANTDCVQCVEHAHRVNGGTIGACECDERWEGLSCSIYDNAYCYPTCAGCFGPYAADCDQCIEKAYRDDQGACVCKPGWGEVDCSYWTGLCDQRCLDCIGPGNEHCVSCVEHGEMQGDSCRCSDGWTGSDCSYFKGVCDTRCYGCHGPSNTECEYCVEHAYKNEDGECVCDPMWYDEMHCNRPYAPCHVLCAKCAIGATNTCESCFKGYYLSNLDDMCTLCDNNCAECVDEPNNCTVCHDGFYLDEESVCQPCYPSCKTCNGHSQHCTSCFDDVTFDEDSGECVCKEGGRDAAVGLCYPQCATGWKHYYGEEWYYNHWCKDFENIEAKFETTSSLFTSCHAPTYHSSRGAYFDGHSFLEMEEFYASSMMSFNLWVRMESAGYLMSFEYALLPFSMTADHNSPYDRDYCDDHDAAAHLKSKRGDYAYFFDECSGT